MSKRKPKKKEIEQFIDRVTDPTATEHELKETLDLEGELLQQLFNDCGIQREAKRVACEKIRGLWGVVLTRLLQKSIEGDITAIKIIFDYVDKARLLDDVSRDEYNPKGTTLEQRQELQSALIRRIVELKQADTRERTQ